MKCRCVSLAFLGLLVLPLQKEQGWTDLKFSQSPKNQISFSPSGLQLSVNHSSSPLFYRLEEVLAIKEVRMKFDLLGLPQLSKDRKEGDDSNDDFPLRLGLVLTGDTQLNWFQRLFAPLWLKELSEKSEPHQLKKVLFLTIAQTLPVGTKRFHPKSELLEEEVVLQVNQPGSFDVTWKSDKPVETYALWIQADGDDTRSSFNTLVKEITLEFR